MPTQKRCRKPTLLLADDHVIVIEGLRNLLQTEFELVGAVRDGWALLAAAERLAPDVIVVDVSMPVLNGIDAIRRLKKAGSHSKVVFLYFVGQVKNMKASMPLEWLTGEPFYFWSAVCASLLARTHCRMGDAAKIAGYRGKSEALDEALAEFAESYPNGGRPSKNFYVDWATKAGKNLVELYES